MMFRANIYFNRQCINKKVAPKYAKIKLPHTSLATSNTLNKIQKIHIKDEIKFPYPTIFINVNTFGIPKMCIAT
jgi:hypothetical protein